MLKNKNDLINKVSSDIISVLCDHYIFLLMFITATGLFLRFSGLNVTPLTSGEMAVTSFSRLPVPHIQATIENGSILHPPFYYWIQHFFFMFGVTEFSIRFLPALCGTLSIPVTYLLGKEFHSKDTEILAAAIITISPYHIFCSQDGTPYSMMLLIILVSLVFFVHMIKADSSASGACFGFFSGLAFWVMYYSIILTFSLLLFELVERKMDFRKRFGENRALYMGIMFFLFVIIPLPGLIHDLEKVPALMSFHRTPVGWVLESLNQFYVLNKPLMIVTMILLLIGIAGLFRYNAQLFSLLLFMMIVPAVLGMVLSYWIPFEPQYALLVLPAVCTGAGFSYAVIYSLLSRWIMVSRLKVLVIFLLLFCALSLPLV